MQNHDVYDLHSTQLEIVLVSIEKELERLSNASHDTYSLESFYKTCINAQGFAIEREMGA
jgi:hypothetical protein